MNIEQERADFEAWALRERIAYRDEKYGVCFYNGERNSYWIGYQAGQADRKRMEAPAAEGWPEPLSEFSEGQWWVKELDALKDLPGASNDQKRAVAVVHHLLASVDLHFTQEKKSDY